MLTIFELLLCCVVFLDFVPVSLNRFLLGIRSGCECWRSLIRNRGRRRTGRV